VAKRACYTKKLLKAAKLIAAKFITKGLPIQVENMDKIYASRICA
jgi:hypothetical protein